MARKHRIAAARTVVAAVIAAGGSADEALAGIEVLRAKDRSLFQSCEKLIRAGNPKRVLRLLDQAGGEGPPAPALEDAGALARRAAVLSWISVIVWGAVASTAWFVGRWLAPTFVLVGIAWVVTVIALRAGGVVASLRYQYYSGFEHLGALVFLLVLTPLGLIWTLARAVRIHGGKVDGPGYNPQPGGGYGGFEVGRIDDAGRPMARALVAVAIGHVVAIAAILVRSGLIDEISIG